MPPVYPIARKEWREIPRSGLFRVGSGILLLLLLMSLYTRFGYYQRMSRQQALSQGFRFASPAILMQQALERLAGTDAARLRQLEVISQQGWQQWWDFFAGHYMDRESFTAAAYGAMPKLGPGAVSGTPVGGALLGLALMVGIVWGLGRWRAR